MGKDNLHKEGYEITVSHTEEKTITLDDIIECTFGFKVEELADMINRGAKENEICRNKNCA